MLPEYDIFEKLPDGSSIWRGCVPGQYDTERKLQDLAEHLVNEVFAVEINSRQLQQFIVLRSKSHEHIARRSKRVAWDPNSKRN
jgi:hypothetical protein